MPGRIQRAFSTCWGRLCLVFPLLLFVRRTAAQSDNLVLSCDPCIDRSKVVMHAVVHGTKDDPDWQKSIVAMQQAATDMGFANGFQVELYDEYSSEAMAQTIRSLIQNNQASGTVRQIDGLIVSVPDDIVQAAVQDAIQAGIHVWGVGLGAEVANDIGMLGFVGQDEYNAGSRAAIEFKKRRLNIYGPAKRAIFINHDPNEPAFEQRFQGFNQTLSTDGVAVDHFYVDPDDFYATVLQMQNAMQACGYDFVLLAGHETVPAASAAFDHNVCGEYLDQIQSNITNGTAINFTTPFESLRRPMMIGTFDDTAEILDAMAAEKIAFALAPQNYLQSALPVIMATMYATTGKQVVLPGGPTSTYISGPRVVDPENYPSDTYIKCESEAFPVCEHNSSKEQAESPCPCIDRSRIKIAGVVHGVVGDVFWDDVFDAAKQASLDMHITLDMERWEPASDDLLHRKMASKIMAICGSGVDGIIVSMPSSIVEDAVRFCKQLRIPVININAGFHLAKELGVLHVGQLEREAGAKAAERMVQAQVEKGFCLIHEQDNVALEDRCQGFKEQLELQNRTYGGTVIVPRDRQSHYTTIVEDTVGDVSGIWDGIGLVVSGELEPALTLRQRHPAVTLGKFDMMPTLFEPMNDGRVLFAIDQQPFLQGSMAVYLLAYTAYTKQALLNDAMATGPLVVEQPSNATRQCEELHFAVCTQIPAEDYNFLPQVVIIFGSCAVALVCFFGLVALVWIYWYREKNIVKASQPLFLGLIILGCTVAIMAIVPLSAETEYRYLKDPYTGKLTDIPNPAIPRVDAACMLVPWLTGMGFVLVFSALCAKIQRIKMIYAAGAAMRRKKVRVKDVLMYMVVMLAMEVTILLCWTLISPNQWDRIVLVESDGYVLESYGTCLSDDSMMFSIIQTSFHAVCLLVALILCWQASEIPTEFAEGSYISLSVLCIFQVSVITIPLQLMIRESPEVSYFVESASLFLSNFTVLLLIFLPKMWRVSTGNDQLPIRLPPGGRSTDYYRPTTFDNVTLPSGPVPSGTQTTDNQLPTRPSEQASPCSNSQPPSSTDPYPTNFSTEPSIADSHEIPHAHPCDEAVIDDGTISGAISIAGALSLLKAGLDAEYSSSSLLDEETHSGSVGEELASLAAEITRAAQSRSAAFAAAGETAPAMISKLKATSPPPSADNNPAAASAENIILADTSCRRESYKLEDSSDVDSCLSSTEGDHDSNGAVPVDAGGSSRGSSNRPSSPDEDISISCADGVNETTREAPLIVNRIPWDHAYTNSMAGAYKNPQEGSIGSIDEQRKGEQEAMSPGSSQQRENDSRITITSDAVTAHSAIFETAPSKPTAPTGTPIRLKKEPQEYGENAALALCITKAQGSFLRKVAASFGTTSLDSASKPT